MPLGRGEPRDALFRIVPTLDEIPMLLRGRHYRTGESIDVLLKSDRIAAVAPSHVENTCRPPADVEAPWIAPALCDVQINGALGISFGSPSLTVDEVRKVVHHCRKHGIGELCPTLITASHEDLVHGFRTLARACDDPDLAHALVGFHLEGPFLSPLDGPRGAHPAAHIRDPNWDEFRRLQDAAGGRIRMVTIAPERPGAIALIEHLSKAGVVVAIGHTAMATDDLRAAIAAGAKTSTHLGNGAHAVLPRHPNYLWDQLAADELWASLIVDGHHLPAAVVKSFLRVKTPSRLLLTCDASPLAGLPPGRYRYWDTNLEILPCNKIVVAGTPYLAGSGDFLDTCVRVMMTMTGVPLAEAIDLASAQPRRLLGMEPRTLDVGQPADLVLFEHSASQPFQVTEMVQGMRIERTL